MIGLYSKLLPIAICMELFTSEYYGQHGTLNVCIMLFMSMNTLDAKATGDLSWTRVALGPFFKASACTMISW